MNVGKDYEDWSAWYRYRNSDFSSRENDYSLKQELHEVRGSYQAKSLSDRLTVFASGQIRRGTSDSETPAGSIFAQPVPARSGLYSDDLTPETSQLDTVPGLIDGDTNTPVEPEINIGGANTFQNIGLDFGFSRPITQ